MKKINKIQSIMLIAIVAISSMFTLNSCKNDDVTGVALHSFGPCPVLRGESINVIGTDLGQVSKVVFPGAEGTEVEVAAFAEQTDTKIVVAVPQEAMPGHLKIVYGGSTIESKSKISFKEPITVDAVTPTDNLVAGDVITVTGDYVYNIASATFANGVVVDSEDFVEQTRKELKITVPKEAVSGTITFSDGADTPTLIEYETPLSIQTASYSALSATSVAEGQTITISGTNLQLVKEVVYPGDINDLTFNAAAGGATLTTTVPTGIGNGAITLILYSGAKLTTDEISIPTIAYTSISPATNVQEGDVLTITGTNLNLVDHIVMPGEVTVEKANLAVSNGNTTLTLTVPAGVIDGKLKLVQNSNISVETDAISMKKEGNTIWTGNVNLGTTWGTTANIDASVFANVAENGLITIKFAENSDATYWQLKPMDGNWTVLTSIPAGDMNAWSCIDLAAGATEYTFKLNVADAAALKSSGAVLSGYGLTITGIDYSGK